MRENAEFLEDEMLLVAAEMQTKTSTLNCTHNYVLNIQAFKS
jgi:hypothetical protein